MYHSFALCSHHSAYIPDPITPPPSSPQLRNPCTHSSPVPPPPAAPHRHHSLPRLFSRVSPAGQLGTRAPQTRPLPPPRASPSTCGRSDRPGPCHCARVPGRAAAGEGTRGTPPPRDHVALHRAVQGRCCLDPRCSSQRLWDGRVHDEAFLVLLGVQMPASRASPLRSLLLRSPSVHVAVRCARLTSLLRPLLPPSLSAGCSSIP